MAVEPRAPEALRIEASTRPSAASSRCSRSISPSSRRAGLLPRAVGLRQDDAAAHHRRPRAADARPRRPERPRRVERAAGGARLRHRVPVVCAVSRTSRSATTSRTASSTGARRAPRSTARVEGAADARRPARCRAQVSRRSCPAASSSASRSRARWRRRRRCCCWTSRCRRSTPRSASGCAARSASCSGGSSVTTIMVTHDQEEALSMADRVVVMNQGAIEQVGTPQRRLRAAGHAVRRRLPRQGQRAEGDVRRRRALPRRQRRTRTRRQRLRRRRPRCGSTCAPRTASLAGRTRRSMPNASVRPRAPRSSSSARSAWRASMSTASRPADAASYCRSTRRTSSACGRARDVDVRAARRPRPRVRRRRRMSTRRCADAALTGAARCRVALARVAGRGARGARRPACCCALALFVFLDAAARDDAGRAARGPGTARSSASPTSCSTSQSPALARSAGNTLTFAVLTTLRHRAAGVRVRLRDPAHAAFPAKGLWRNIALIPILAPSLLAALSFIYLFGNQGVFKFVLRWFGLDDDLRAARDGAGDDVRLVSARGDDPARGAVAVRRAAVRGRGIDGHARSGASS